MYHDNCYLANWYCYYREDFSKIFYESPHRHTEEFEVRLIHNYSLKQLLAIIYIQFHRTTTISEASDLLKTYFPLKEPRGGNGSGEEISLYGRMTKHHVCLKCSKITDLDYKVSNGLLAACASNNNYFLKLRLKLKLEEMIITFFWTSWRK